MISRILQQRTEIAGARESAYLHFDSLIAVMGGLLGAGLVWPLFYLSSRGGGWRDWALRTFIVLVGLFLLFLLNEVRGLRSSLDLRRRWW
jgi:hypothetical protein